MNYDDVFFFQAEDGIRDGTVTGVQTCALPISLLKDEGRPPCQALGAYTSSPKSRVRESAVRVMDDAACSDFQAYSGYLLDSAAGVVDALIDAARRRLMA